MALTAKQQLFVKEYLIDLNATQAAIRAGYSDKRASEIGYQLLQKTTVQAAIKEEMDKRSKRTEITADMVLREYAKIGFSNITDYLKVEEKEYNTELGTRVFKMVDVFETVDINPDKMSAVAEIKQTREGIALKLHDKKGALDSIARHLGMFIDNSKVELSGEVSHKHKHDLRKLDPKELADLERILSKTADD